MLGVSCRRRGGECGSLPTHVRKYLCTRRLESICHFGAEGGYLRALLACSSLAESQSYLIIAVSLQLAMWLQEKVSRNAPPHLSGHSKKCYLGSRCQEWLVRRYSWLIMVVVLATMWSLYGKEGCS